MTRNAEQQTLCPIARAAAIVADRWIVLILRELRLGNDRFDGIQAQTGMSSALLTQRLQFMEEHGLITRSLYHERPKRYRYEQTHKAHELDSMMLNLRLWGMRHCGLDPAAEGAVTMTHVATGQTIDADWQGADRTGLFSFDETASRINPEWAKERAEREEHFTKDKRRKVEARAKK